MQLVNYTPWSHLLFERRDTHDRALAVLALQGTFELDPGKPLRASSCQEPVLIGDAYRGDPATASPYRAGALATFKPKSDIHLDAVARAPGGKPLREWPVRVRVGRVTKDVLVRGPHVWVHTPMLGWSLGTPQPTPLVPIAYERAFGGSFRIDGKLVEVAENPVGTGFLPPGISTREPVPAPQVVALDEPAHRPGARYTPHGLGPIPSYFAPRRDRIGTVDRRWLETQWPCVPADFDYAHYQSAHPDLVYPGYLAGDEVVELVNLGARGGTVLTSLPRWSVWLLLRLHDGRLLPWLARLDTVHFAIAADDPREHRAYLTWRAVFPFGLNVRRAEARMVRLGEEGRVRAA